jgi:hypothetical protein
MECVQCIRTVDWQTPRQFDDSLSEYSRSIGITTLAGKGLTVKRTAEVKKKALSVVTFPA